MSSLAQDHTGYDSVLLDSVATRGSGHTPKKGRADYWGGGIRWVSLKDSPRLDRGLIVDTAETITERGLVNSSAVVHPAGSVVLLRDAGVGKSAVLGSDMAVSQHFMAWRCGPRLDNWYLYYYLQHLKLEFERISNGSTIKTIGLPYFRQLVIPLPSIAEQHAVSMTLRDADGLTAALEQQVAKKQAIKQGLMQQLLSGKTRLPGFDEQWQSVTLGSLGTFLKGRGVRRDDVCSSGVPCIRYGELYTEFDNYTAATRSFVSQQIAATALPIRSGDLLFAGSGETRPEIGMCVAYVGKADAVAGGDIVVLRGSGFNPVYIATLANTPAVANQRARAGQGDAIVHISSRALAAIHVRIPPQPEQDAIAGALVDADREIAAFRSRLTKARAIKAGMMQQLLTGRTCLFTEAAS